MYKETFHPHARAVLGYGIGTGPASLGAGVSQTSGIAVIDLLDSVLGSIGFSLARAQSCIYLYFLKKLSNHGH
jgi:hypothetical protein